MQVTFSPLFFLEVIFKRMGILLFNLFPLICFYLCYQHVIFTLEPLQSYTTEIK